MLPNAAPTPAGEALRALLPPRSDPYATIELAAHVAFLVRDRDLMPDLLDVVKAYPDLAAGLIVTLACLVDIDARPQDLLGWLGDHAGRGQETTRMVGAMAEARSEYEEEAADTLPPVTLESMRAMRHNAVLAGVMLPCGTTAAYNRHINRKQRPCSRCTTARWLYDNAGPEQRALLKRPLDGYDKVGGGGTKPPMWRPSCGRRAGYVAHKKANEEPCDPCYAGLREHSRRRYDERLARLGKVRVPVTSPVEPNPVAELIDLAVRRVAS